MSQRHNASIWNTCKAMVILVNSIRFGICSTLRQVLARCLSWCMGHWSFCWRYKWHSRVQMSLQRRLCLSCEFFCLMVDGKIHLKKKHGYYRQVQFQLYVASDCCNQVLAWCLSRYMGHWSFCWRYKWHSIVQTSLQRAEMSLEEACQGSEFCCTLKKEQWVLLPGSVPTIFSFRLL